MRPDLDQDQPFGVLAHPAIGGEARGRGPMIATSNFCSAMAALPTDGFASLPQRNIAAAVPPASAAKRL
jgi:hypothetical protein